MGSDSQTKLCWDQDALDDCSPEDQVWGWSVQLLEILHYNQAKFDDKVLHQMLYQGLLDKKPGALAWTKPTSIKHGVCFVLSMIIQVLQKCFTAVCEIVGNCQDVLII